AATALIAPAPTSACPREDCMMRKWIIALILAPLLALVSAFQALAQINIRVGFPDPLTTTWGQSLQEFKRIVESDSNARMKFSLYRSEQLGSLVEMIENVRIGAQEISLASPAVFSQFY